MIIRAALVAAAVASICAVTPSNAEEAKFGVGVTVGSGHDDGDHDRDKTVVIKKDRDHDQDDKKIVIKKDRDHDGDVDKKIVIKKDRDRDRSLDASRAALQNGARPERAVQVSAVTLSQKTSDTFASAASVSSTSRRIISATESISVMPPAVWPAVSRHSC